MDVNSRFKRDGLTLVAPELGSLPTDLDLYRYDGYRGLKELAGFSRRAEFYGQLQRGLKKVDMASMHCSLEVRVPILDREVIDFSLHLEPAAHLAGGVRKKLLRDLLQKFVPPDEIPLQKRGFAVPLGEWLRGPLRALVEDYLIDRPLYPEGIFDVRGLRSYWKAHLTGAADNKCA